MANYFGSICLSDIDKSLIRIGKNGKKYLSICINEKKEADQYGNTHYIKSYNTNKDAKANFIGDLKPSQYQQNVEQSAQPAPAEPQNAPADIEKDDSLPF